MDKENRSTSSVSTTGSRQTQNDEINETQPRKPNAEEDLPEPKKPKARTIRQSLSDFVVQCLHPWSASTESSDQQCDKSGNALYEYSDRTSNTHENTLLEMTIHQRQRTERESSSMGSEGENMLDRSQGLSTSYEELSSLEEFLLAISFETSDNVPYLATKPKLDQKPLVEVTYPVISESERQETVASINFGNPQMTKALGGRKDMVDGNWASTEGFLRTSRSECVIPLPIRIEPAKLSDEPEWVAVNDGETIPQSQGNVEVAVKSIIFAAHRGHVSGTSNVRPLPSESTDMNLENNPQILRCDPPASARTMWDTDMTGITEPAGGSFEIENDLEQRPEGCASACDHGSKSNMAKYGLPAWKMDDETTIITTEKIRLSSGSVHLGLGLDGEVDQAFQPQEMQLKTSSHQGSIAAKVLTTPATRISPFVGFFDQDSNGRDSLHSLSTVRLSKTSAHMNPTIASRRSLFESCCSGEYDDYMTKGTHNLRQLEGIARQLEAGIKLKSTQTSAQAGNRPEIDGVKYPITETKQPQRSGEPGIGSQEEPKAIEDTADRLLRPTLNNDVPTTSVWVSSSWQRKTLLKSSEELKPSTLRDIAPSAEAEPSSILCDSLKSTDHDSKAVPEATLSPVGFVLTHSDEPFRVYLSDLACKAPGKAKEHRGSIRLEHIAYGDPKQTDTAQFEKTLDRTFRLGQALTQENLHDEALSSENMILPAIKCGENIDLRLSIASKMKRQLSWKVNIKRNGETSVENDEAVTLPNPSFVSSEPMPRDVQANAIYNLVTDQSDLEISINWAAIPNGTTTTGEEDDYRILRALLETVSGPRYWVFHVEELQCEKCMKELTESRLRHVAHSVEMTAKSIRANHSHCNNYHYDISCTHETRIGELFRHIGVDTASRIQYLRVRSHQNGCINPDHFASAIESLKGRLPGLQSIKVDLHLPGYEHCLTNKQRDKKLICSLQKLETFLPPKARLIISQLDKHKDLEKRWRSVRRGWWIGTFRD